jgi:hypothetical protein
MADGHFPYEPIGAFARRFHWTPSNSRDFAARNPVADLELVFELDSGLCRGTKQERKLRAQPWLTERIQTDSKTQGR